MGNNYVLKVIMLGDGGVGKTDILKQFMGKKFRDEHLMTIGADFVIRDMIIGEDKIKFEIHDLAGQDTFKSVRARFYRGAMGGLCVFDITNKESFIALTKWIEELWRYCGRGIVPIILLGNKMNLKLKRIISLESMKKYADALSKKTEQYGFIVHAMDISTETGDNIELAFETLGKQIIEGLQNGTIMLK